MRPRDSSLLPIAARGPLRRTVAVALLAALVLAMLWLGRAALLEWLAEAVLTAQGLGPADVEVKSIGLGRATVALRGSALGSIDRVDVDYRLGLPTGLRLERVRVAGARLRLPRRAGSASPGAGDGVTEIPDFVVQLADVQVTALIGGQVVKVQVDGELSGGRQAAGQLRYVITAPRGRLLGTMAARARDDKSFEGALTLDQGELALGALAVRDLRGQLDVQIGGRGLERLDGHFTAGQVDGVQRHWGAVSLAVAQPAPDAVRLALDGADEQLVATMALPAAGAARSLVLDGRWDVRMLAALLPQLRVGSGTLAVKATVEAPAAMTSPHDWLQAGHLQADVQLHASSIDVRDLARINDVSAMLACRLEAGQLACTSSGGLRLDGAALAPRWSGDDSLLAGGASLAIAARGDTPLIAIAATDQGHALVVAADLSLQSARLGVRAPVDVRLTLDGPLSVADVTAAPRSARFEIRGGVDAERQAGQPWLSSTYALRGHCALDAATYRLTRLELEDGEIVVPRQGWAASGLRGSYVAGVADIFSFSVSALRSTRDPALVVPLAAHVNARVGRDQARYDAVLRDSAGVLELTLAGRHQRRSGQGDLEFKLRPIVLAGGESVRAIAPAFGADISAASGEIALSGGAQWGAGTQRSGLSLRVRDVALAMPGLKVSRLDAHVDLDNLAPLHSAAGQTLSGTLVVPAFKDVPLALRFNVADNHLHVEHARADVFGGAFQASAGDIDIAGGATTLDVEVVDIDLDSAFTVLDLKQLRGSGRIGGHLPLRFEGGHIAVQQGRLEAAGPGTIHIGANAVTDQLKTHGKDVDLAFRALEDFHYRSLEISADKPFTGAGKAMFHLEGDSPTVAPGQPFVFNVSLETDFDYLAAVLLQLSGITNSALGWGAGELLRK